MERHFDEELAVLKNELISMGRAAENSIHDVIDALASRDIKKAQAVIDNDEVVDQLELVIDDKCLSLLSLFQPQASDLRFITNATKISADLERIADLSTNMAQRVLELAPYPLIKPLDDIPELGRVAQSMVKNAIESIVNRDVEMARKVIQSDREADTLRDRVQKELIENYLMKDGSTTPRVLPLLFIARHLERICDHAVNIAEDVIHMVSARVVKHSPDK